MNWILGIDTSSIDLGIGLFQDLDPVACYSRFIRNSHAEHIAQVVDMLLNVNGVEGKDITRIAVSVGPGSFTGLRIGIAFVKGFCFGRTAAVLPVSSLEVLAYTARNHNGRIISAIDARNDDVFFGIFESVNGSIRRLQDDKVTNSSEFRATLLKDDTIVTDKMGYTRSTVFDFLVDFPSVLPVERFHVQRGLFCAEIGAKAIDIKDNWKSGIEVVPNYLRASAAAQKHSKVNIG
jgi:tRNA threonylcarbamoyl adenosine modification protein YeaZ